ncbi:hypothetical protein FA15DRAFT_575451, partial [Coprinopsis marcescibilis]
MATGSGTSNLRTGVAKCLDHNHITQPSADAKVIAYSPENHHALIALRCTAWNRPFNMVADPEYIQEVQMLHSNTPIPHPSTVSTDVQQIYVTMSNIVRDYLVVS